MTEADDITGLSKTERSIIQDEGETGIGQENESWRKWRFKIKEKARPTIIDALLIVKHSDGAIDIADYLRLNCRAELVDLRDEITRILAL